MQAHGIRVNDRFALVQPRVAQLQLPKNVHFTEPASQALAEQVAAVITAELARKPVAKKPEGK